MVNGVACTSEHTKQMAIAANMKNERIGSAKEQARVVQCKYNIAKRGLVLSRGREDFSTRSRICLGSRARTWQIANHKRRRGGVGTLLLSWDMDGSCK